MDLPPPPPALTTYADVAFHHHDHAEATLPDYPQPRQVPTPLPAEIDQARTVYPEDPNKASRHEAAVINWSTRSRSPNYCPARREAPPVMPVFGNDRPGEALRYNVCISSLGDIPGVLNQNVQAAIVIPMHLAVTAFTLPIDILSLPAGWIREIGNMRNMR